jgi:hypothetical protein
MAYYCEFIVSEQKNTGPVIPIAVITHHKPVIFYFIVFYFISTLGNNLGNLLL